MRKKVTKKELSKFMKLLAASARSFGRIYFTGGSTALLYDFREQTIDIDIKLDPEPEGVFEAIAKIKKQLNINVELASPDNFIPVSKDWHLRSNLIEKGKFVEFYHYDFYSQALAKIERGHEQDISDVTNFVEKNLIDLEKLSEEFDIIKKSIVRYPALNQSDFQKKVDSFIKKFK